MRRHCASDVRFATNVQVQEMLARHDKELAALNERTMKRRQQRREQEHDQKRHQLKQRQRMQQEKK